ncbi:type IX secretion system protein PorQ [Parabacteroides sp. OttesenSCG-928-N08]|nr:type IX secretion system protein PorQ [Parabacteroides sp. OttesenSCG-928-N08]
MRTTILISLFSVFAFAMQAQHGEEVFSFLRYPSSARANALGGHTVALIERDPALAFHNPGLLGGEMDGMINMNYMNYIADINMGSALFTKAHKERGAWAIGITYINYGDFKEALPESPVVGTFSANDINLTAIYAYDLSDRWRGGLALKFLYSGFADFSSIGLGVDAGLSYYNDESQLSLGVAFKNIGAQITAYEEERQKMPWDIQLGLTKKMEHAPIRLSVTAMYLNRWKFDYIDNTNAEYEGDNFAKTLAKHLVFGVDLVPSDNFWVGIGFNPKRNMDMKLQNGNKFAGFSAGAGVRIKRLDIGASLAKYHPSALSFMLSASFSLYELVP